MTKHNNIFKSGLKEVSNTILIGGVDPIDLPTKENIGKALLDQSLKEAREEALKIVDHAKLQASQLLEDANAQVEKITQDAYAAGYSAGHAKAEQDLHNKLSHSLESIAEILNSIELERKEALEHEQERVYKIVVLLAKQIIKHEPSFSKESMLELISEVIMRLDNKARVTVLVNPKLASILNPLKTQLLTDFPSLENLAFSVDDNLGLHDIVVESHKERLDARVDTQVDNLIKQGILKLNS